MHAELRCTYRLQLRDSFGFDDAAELIPYLADLGVSHLYLSPILKATATSEHGYDATDPTEIEPRFGGEAGLHRLFERVRAHGMGVVLDIVPNHLSATHENPWWWDVLENGEAGQHAPKFDIDWSAPRILLPVLGDHLGNVLARGELAILENAGEVPVFSYFDALFPLNAASLQMLREGVDDMARLLSVQHYRLAYFRVGAEEINYRRFFNVPSLIGVRVEDSEVFQATHRKLLEMVASGPVDGLRIDHPDGLRDPAGYFSRLREAVPGQWLIAEKILEPGEVLPKTWQIDGTTGYDFLNRVAGPFVHPDRAQAFTEGHQKFTGDRQSYAELVLDQKRRIATKSFAAELRRLAELLRKSAISGDLLDVSHKDAAAVLTECLAAFPVYRTYVTPGKIASEGDSRSIARALAIARKSLPDGSDQLIDLLKRRLNGGPERTGDEMELVARFQQLSGPVMAKGVEDTVFYCYGRLLAQNEVGGDPSRFGSSVAGFHDEMVESHASWPQSMLASSTHDTKRSEDVRSRLHALSERDGEWFELLDRWSAAHQSAWEEVPPDRHAEEVFYQTWLGSWPISDDRMQTYLLKACREAKRHTSWTDPEPTYEEALRRYVRTAMADPATSAEVARFAKNLIADGNLNSLSQTLLKLTCPGIPDLYQGCELWNLHLVDPDNRLPVDFDLRRRRLEELRDLSVGEIMKREADGLPKLYVIQRTLALRKSLPECFAPGPSGLYVPLHASGAQASHLIAFRRGEQVTVAVPRLVGSLAGRWENTRLSVGPGEWHSCFDGRSFGDEVEAADLFRDFPVALLKRVDLSK